MDAKKVVLIEDAVLPKVRQAGPLDRERATTSRAGLRSAHATFVLSRSQTSLLNPFPAILSLSKQLKTRTFFSPASSDAPTERAGRNGVREKPSENQ